MTKTYIVQIIRSDSCTLYIDFPEGEEHSREKAIEEATDLSNAGLIKDDEWEPIKGYEYYILDSYDD